VLTFDYDHAIPRSWLISCCARRWWPDEARANKASNWQAHYAHLLVHGTLHAQGWDHEDAGRGLLRWKHRRVDILLGLGLADPYAPRRGRRAR
jgi:probable rRNA maturation factor